MLNETAQHLWWKPTDPYHPDSYDVYIQAGKAVYRSSRADDAWYKVLADPDPTRFVFARPLNKVLFRCLSGTDGIKYILFSDKTAIRVFNSPALPGMVRISASAAGFVSPPEYESLFEEGIPMPDTPIIFA